MTTADIIQLAKERPDLLNAPLAWELALHGATPAQVGAAAQDALSRTFDVLHGTLANRLAFCVPLMPTDARLIARARAARRGGVGIAA